MAEERTYINRVNNLEVLSGLTPGDRIAGHFDTKNDFSRNIFYGGEDENKFEFLDSLGRRKNVKIESFTVNSGDIYFIHGEAVLTNYEHKAYKIQEDPKAYNKRARLMGLDECVE